MKATVTVDEVGRMVLPKEIREAIGVSGRTTVKIEVVDNAARITAPETAARATGRRRGRLVYTGSLPEKWDSGEAVLQMRERRLRLDCYGSPASSKQWATGDPLQSRALAAAEVRARCALLATKH